MRWVASFGVRGRPPESNRELPRRDPTEVWIAGVPYVPLGKKGAVSKSGRRPCRPFRLRGRRLTSREGAMMGRSKMWFKVETVSGASIYINSDNCLRVRPNTGEHGVSAPSGRWPVSSLVALSSASRAASIG